MQLNAPLTVHLLDLFKADSPCGGVMMWFESGDSVEALRFRTLTSLCHVDRQAMHLDPLTCIIN